ncbi:MAG TPA: hypothetical protein VII13_08395 [Vicinamibacteria bacterium]|jgi:chromosome segregation ATPase
MDLDAAAAELVKKCTAFDAPVDAATALLDSLEAKLKDLTEELDEEWDGLVEAITSLYGTVEEEDKELVKEAKEALDALTAVKTAIDAQADALQESVENAAGAMDALEKGATALGPKLEEAVEEGIEKKAAAIQKWAEEADSALGDALDAATKSMQDDVVEELEQAQSFADMFGKAAANIATGAGGKLVGLFEEWAVRVTQVRDSVKNDGFDKAGPHAAKAVDAAMDECQSEHETAFGEMWPLLEQARNELQELLTDIEAKRDGAVEDEPKLATEITELKSALTDAVTALDGAAEYLRERGCGN